MSSGDDIEATEAEPKSGWRRKLLTVPGLIATTVLTALVGAGVTWTVNYVREANFHPSDAVKLSVESDPDKIGMYMSSRAAMIPSNVRTHGSPGQGCKGFHSWFVDNQGVDANETVVQITAQGTTDKPVFIRNIHVDIIDRSPPLTGIEVSCPVGGLGEARPVVVNLDTTPPAVDYKPDCQRVQGCEPETSTRVKSPVGFSLAKGETESFIVSATAAKATYRWKLYFDVVVNGEEAPLAVGSGFSTTALPSGPHTAWGWNWKDAWTSYGNPDPDLNQKNVPASDPLPAPN
jgi:hypothetical protein